MSPRVTPDNRIPDIVGAAIDVFSRKGYRLAQMEEIAAEAAVSKATLYYYFKSKARLFHYVLENGTPYGNGKLPPPETASSMSEGELLELLRRRLKKGSRISSIQAFLRKGAKDIDLTHEIAEILGEFWDICERNRIQIVILEKSAFEFPELADVYDRYARRQALRQLEEYLTVRIRMGAIRPLHSVPATARFMLESLAWFGFKQLGGTAVPLFSKSETLPDLISIFVAGLRT